MKLLAVRLGVRSDTWHPVAESRIITRDMYCEFTPDEVFRACNRIVCLEQDLDDLDHEWQRDLRRQLDFKDCPSMSVKDTIHVESIGTWTCANRGWTFVPADRSLPL